MFGKMKLSSENVSFGTMEMYAFSLSLSIQLIYFHSSGCMISDYRGFPGTGKCWHGLRTEPCHKDMLYVARCDSDQRQEFNVIPMKGGTQYQIAVHDEDRCLERLEYSLILASCNENNPLQRFWMPRGATYQKRFELSPITLANYCVTQSHHPKSVSETEQECTLQYHLQDFLFCFLFELLLCRERLLSYTNALWRGTKNINRHFGTFIRKDGAVGCLSAYPFKIP